METALKRRPAEIWVIAGGKGGTGKSFLISSFGLYLARKEHRVTLVDGDIGGANLHSFLGISRPTRSLTEFFEAKVPLADLVETTDIPNLNLISGDIHSLASGSIRYAQKKKLFRHILQLNAEYVLMDVGAGSHPNVLDSFLQADRMIVVIVPEMIAIENLYHFIKNAIFRKLRLTLKSQGYKEIVQYVWARRHINDINSVKELLDYLLEFPEIGSILAKELSRFKVLLIVNKTRDREDILLGSSVKSAMIKHLGVNTQYAGFIEYEDGVWRSTRKNRPFLLDYRASRCAKEIETIVENVSGGRDIRLHAS